MKPSQKHADSAFYGIAAKEIQAGNVDVGLMAKAVAKAKGNKKEAEVLYLEWRVDLIKEQALEEAKAEKVRLEKAAAEEAKAAEETKAAKEAKCAKEAAAKRAKAVDIAAGRGTLRATQNYPDLRTQKQYRMNGEQHGPE